VQLLDWVSASNYTILVPANYGLANAVRVTVTYNVPLVFGRVIGISSKGASRSCTAQLNTYTQNVWVSANGNLWLAGEPTGTKASQPDPGWEGQGVNPEHPWEYDLAGPVGGHAWDGENYSSPQTVTIPITPGSLIRVSNVSGTGQYDFTGSWSDGNANGSYDGSTEGIYDDAAANGVSEHGIADVYMPLDSMNAVFLGSGLPDSTPAPSTVLDFSTQAARDYSTLSPQLKQPFYVGTGQTSGGSQQTVVVPKGATRLFIGMMDGWEWSNNAGGYNATITEISVQTVQ
jgi:hypothetical protein